jgi:NDP-4-keto-2,6-dideoxyhexose 3-C-methyltransferase
MRLLSLGDLYVSDFLAPGEEPRAGRFPLELVRDPDGLVHLSEQPPPELMWGRYWYRSGTNESMRRALADVVASTLDVVSVEVGDLWVDVASNDGTLLGAVEDMTLAAYRPYLVGVDPADDSFRYECEQIADLVVQEPFTEAIADQIRAGFGRAKVVTCIAMLYQLADPAKFLEAVRGLLADDGLFVVQLSYTPLMIQQLAFDNVCHEHARYYTLHTLHRTLGQAGFRIVDAQLNDVNGGSIRLLCQRDDADPAGYGTQPQRDVARMRLDSLYAHELGGGYNGIEIWQAFARRLEALRDQVVGFVRDARRRGETVWGYGASTKGNTLLQYFGLDSTLVTAIAERQEQKWGLRTVGTDIPIVAEADMRAARPDYLLVLPWHFIAEFRRREAGYLAAGGRLLVPCPQFQVIGA